MLRYKNNRIAGYMILLCISINCVLYAALLRLINNPLYGILMLLFGILLLVVLTLVAVASYRLLFRCKYTRLSTDGSLLLVHFLPYFVIGNVMSELITLLIYEIHGIQYFYLFPYQAVAGVSALLVLKQLKLVVFNGQTVYMSNFWEDKNILMKQVISIDKITGFLYKISFSCSGQIVACYFVPHFIRQTDAKTGKPMIDLFTAKCYQSHLKNPVNE